MRSYLTRFFDTRSTIANIVNDNIIDCFHSALHDMMLEWADQDEQECIN